MSQRVFEGIQTTFGFFWKWCIILQKSKMWLLCRCVTYMPPLNQHSFILINSEGSQLNINLNNT